MFSRFVRAAVRMGEQRCSALTRHTRVETKVRRYSQLIPPNQYDLPFPKRLHLGYVLREYWEIIPLFLTTCAAMSILFVSIAWACWHKVDVVFSTRNRDNISRTMDLRHPTVNKLIIINQRYEPWPEMQDLLDKMKVAEIKVMKRAETCSLVA